jgi:Protein of unknown function (DUF1631)
VAAGRTNNAVGHLVAHDCKEADQLKLSKEKIPLPLSLQNEVMQRYTDPNQVANAQQAMEWEDLLGYIRTIDNFEQSPLDGVLTQTEVIGDPALPKPGECAALRWVSAAFDLWEQEFPLESELGMKMRALKPVIAVAALSDAAFFTPGTHPLHQIMDALHDAAVGWQPDLGRAGQPVLALLENTISELRGWLDRSGTSLTKLSENIMTTTQRSQARTDRMMRRAAETEKGQMKSAQARSHSANMINSALERYPVSEDVGQILTGPWYDSAQLVILKFGIDSDEWQQMTATTISLLDSLQPGAEEEQDGRRQQLFENIAGIPQQVKRWLLTLQHDDQALEQIMSVIEYDHLRLMRNQPAQPGKTPPIALEGSGSPETDAADIAELTPGQWFRIAQSGKSEQRLQLAMMEGQHLLFCNQAGIKVQAQTKDKFGALLESGKAQVLLTGASFSRALSAAAGIDSDEALRILIGEPEPAAAASETPASMAEAAPEMAVEAEQAIVTDEPVQVDAEATVEPVLPDSGRPELPMGTWLGFHDTDPPLLAKLALHDKVRRLLIFVNRKGIELRRLEEEQYFELIQSGLVDILEAKNNFREQVERARERLERHQR